MIVDCVLYFWYRYKGQQNKYIFSTLQGLEVLWRMHMFCSQLYMYEISISFTCHFYLHLIVRNMIVLILFFPSSCIFVGWASFSCPGTPRYV